MAGGDAIEALGPSPLVCGGPRFQPDWSRDLWASGQVGLSAEWEQPTASAFSWPVSAWARTCVPSWLQAAPTHLEGRLAMLMSIDWRVQPLPSVVSSGLWVDLGGDRTLGVWVL